jgi:hypothetical protein
VLHTDPVLSRTQKGLTLQQETERRLLANYLKEIGKHHADNTAAQEKQANTVVSIQNASFGVFSSGTIQGDNWTVESTQAQTSQEIVKQLRELERLVLEDNASNDEIKTTLLETIAELKRQTSLPPAQRPPTVQVRGLIKLMSESTRTLAAASTIWKNLGPLIAAFFGVPWVPP